MKVIGTFFFNDCILLFGFFAYVLDFLEIGLFESGYFGLFAVDYFVYVLDLFDLAIGQYSLIN